MRIWYAHCAQFDSIKAIKNILALGFALKQVIRSTELKFDEVFFQFVATKVALIRSLCIAVIQMNWLNGKLMPFDKNASIANDQMMLGKFCCLPNIFCR